MSATSAPTILVFDSGFGGLSVFREIARERPDGRFVYAADDAAFPYGTLSEPALIDRVCDVMDGLVARFAPDLVVIACSTASTLALPALRARYAMPFVGTVPAVKPACAASRTRRISVLATPGTVKRDYTADLIRTFAGTCEVTLVPSERLAGLVERAMRGERVSDAELRAEIAPCFVGAPGQGTDTVVLACTHYPLVLDRLKAVAPWPVEWVDPAPAIARRVISLIGPGGQDRARAPVQVVSTGAPLDPAVVASIIGAPVAKPELLPIALAEAS